MTDTPPEFAEKGAPQLDLHTDNSYQFPVSLKVLVVLAAYVLVSAGFGAEPPPDPLESANRLFGMKKYTEAAAAFRGLASSEAAPEVRAKAIFNLGLTLQKLDRYDDAIKTFESLFDFPINDKEPGAHLEPYRNYRPRAQWEIGNCLFAKMDYAKAREAYRITKEKYPFRSWCGNEQAEYQYRYAFFDGVCLEFLGNPNEALKSYYKAAFGTMGMYSSPTVHFRLVDMYEASGQLDAFRALLDQIDSNFMASLKKEMERAGQKPNTKQIEEFRPTALMRRILQMRIFAKDGRLGELIACLKDDRSVAAPPDNNGNWEAREAARLLALTPKESIRELLVALAAAMDANVPWKAYALGRCGTDDGLKWLRKRAAREENIWAARSYFFDWPIWRGRPTCYSRA